MLVLGVVLAMQSSLMHEASHGHPTGRIGSTSFLSGCRSAADPYRRFNCCNRHHADDSDSTDPLMIRRMYYKALWQHGELPVALKWLLSINNTMVGRFFLGPPLATAGFLMTEARLVASGDRAVRKAWLLHLAGLAVVLPLIAFVFEIPLWLMFSVPSACANPSIPAPDFAEHQWSERPRWFVL